MVASQVCAAMPIAENSKWRPRKESNLQPSDLESAALPIALLSRIGMPAKAGVAEQIQTKVPKPLRLFGRSGQVRTDDPLVPNQVRYRAALRFEDRSTTGASAERAWQMPLRAWDSNPRRQPKQPPALPAGSRRKCGRQGWGTALFKRRECPTMVSTFYLTELARVEGFEPPTTWIKAMCSTH